MQTAAATSLVGLYHVSCPMEVGEPDERRGAWRRLTLCCPALVELDIIGSYCECPTSTLRW